MKWFSEKELDDNFWYLNVIRYKNFYNIFREGGKKNVWNANSDLVKDFWKSIIGGKIDVSWYFWIENLKFFVIIEERCIDF